MKSLLFTGIIVVMTTSRIGAGLPENESQVDVDAYVRAISTARSARSVSNNKEDLVDAIGSIEKLGLKPEDAAFASCEYVRCRLLVRASSSHEVDDACFRRLLGSRAVAPEALLGLLEINKGGRERRLALEECFAQVLPISIWRSRVDGSRIVVQADVNMEPPCPFSPVLDRKMLIEVGKEFEQAGLYDQAWKAYIEAIYGGLAPSWIANPLIERAWFSSDSAELWAKVADNAWKAGERQLAYEYLAKAVIFGPEAQLESAKQMLATWGKQKEEEPEVSEEQRKEAVENIVTLYAKMNIHPRALELIQEHNELFDNPDELYRKYASEWTAVVRAYRGWAQAVCLHGVNTSVFLYGVKVSEGDDPTSIRIPWACSPDAIKAILASEN